MVARTRATLGCRESMPPETDPPAAAKRFETARVAGAAAITAGIAYLVCAAFVAIAPDAAVQLLGWLTHVTNLDQIAARGVTMGGVLAGLVQVVLYVYLVTWLFGLTYTLLGRMAHGATGSRSHRIV